MCTFSLKGTDKWNRDGQSKLPENQVTVMNMIVEIVLDDKTYEGACHMASKQKQDVSTFLSNVVGGALLYLEEILT